jgi:two-component system KDP operon response regulator KdpE
LARKELLARIRVALRRVTSDDQTGHLRAGDLTIDYDRRRVLRDDTEIRLTLKEFERLALLAPESRPRVDASRDPESDLGSERGRTTGAFVDAGAQLRRKLEPNPGNPPFLLSDSWVG